MTRGTFLTFIKASYECNLLKVQTEKLYEPELIEISYTMYIHVRVFHQLTDNWLSLKISEKRKSKLSVFLLYGSSFDIVR